jgi:hypothetical protein
VERATRCGSGKAASVGLLTLGLAGCAAVQNPPGGPPDLAPPILLGIEPDSGTINPDFDGELMFEFDEVINERSGNGLENLFHLSPQTEGFRVRWHRQSLGLEPRGGWRPNTVYHIRLDSGLTDLRNNRFGEERTVIFTTGGEIPDTRLTGVVLDWEAGQPASNALIEAVLQQDSLVYLGRTDSIGEFSISSVPTGAYTIYAVLDNNNNGEFERREAFDSLMVALDSTTTGEFWAIQHDTTGPRISTLTPIDSVTFSIEFDQSLTPDAPSPSDVSIGLLPDSTLIQISSIQIQSVYDSIRTRLRAAADSTRRDSLAALDTTTIDTTETIEAATDPTDEDSTEVSGPELEIPDSSLALRLLARRPALETRWVVTVTQPLSRESRYVVDATGTNLIGVTRESRSILIIPELPPEPETDEASPGEPLEPEAVQEQSDSS